MFFGVPLHLHVATQKKHSLLQPRDAHQHTNKNKQHNSCLERSRAGAAAADDGWAPAAGGGAAEEEEGEELCDCRFSLAYGGKILLTNARLRLQRGRRYGLCGANGVGKSTLLRSISRGHLEGFPPLDVLRTVYVEHDLQVGAI